MIQDAQNPLPPGMSDTSPDDTVAPPAATAATPGVRAFRERRRNNATWPILLAIIAFLCGIAAAAIAFPRLNGWWRGNVASSASAVPAAITSGEAVAAAALPADVARQDLLALRMTELEDRLARVSVAAQAAGGNATRSEGMLVAFAARRALDSGAPLGYLEGQLRLRFGQAQPRAVATIINAARDSVTLTDLQASFDEIAPSLRSSPPGTGWWTALQREARDLVIIRKVSTPSPLPEKAIPRIQRLLSAGRVASAMEEVQRLPGKANAERWLQIARRYREARRALDLVETAAILESPMVPAPAGSAAGARAMHQE